MKAVNETVKTAKAAAPGKGLKRVAVTGLAKPGRHRLLPLDPNSVSAVFVTHDRFRAFLRSI